MIRTGNPLLRPHVEDALRRDTIKRMAAELAPALGALIDKVLVSKRSGYHKELENFLWDHKVGILRVLQSVAEPE